MSIYNQIAINTEMFYKLLNACYERYEKHYEDIKTLISKSETFKKCKYCDYCPKSCAKV